MLLTHPLHIEIITIRKGLIAMSEKKHVGCTVCDCGCMLQAEVENQDIINLQGFPNPATICAKALHWREYINHPKRLMQPLKNIGKRGEQK